MLKQVIFVDAKTREAFTDRKHDNQVFCTQCFKESNKQRLTPIYRMDANSNTFLCIHNGRVHVQEIDTTKYEIIDERHPEETFMNKGE